MAFYRTGSLWLKKDKRGRQYLTGNFSAEGGKVYVSIYPNEKKVSEKDPDYLIYRQEIDGKFVKNG